MFYISIKNWDKYQIRNKDYKHKRYWFSFNHNFFDDDKIFELTLNEKMFFIYLLCLRSQSDNEMVSVSEKKAKIYGFDKIDKIFARLKQLELIDISVGGHGAAMARPRSDTTWPLHNITIHNNTKHNITSQLDTLANVEGLNKEEHNEVKAEPQCETSQCNSNIDLAFDAVYKEYPRKEGKKAGYKVFSKLSESDIGRLKIAISNYKTKLRNDKTETKYIKQFSTFMNNWEDYLEPIEDEREAFRKRLIAGGVILDPIK